MLEDDRGAWESNTCVLNTMEARISLVIREDEVGAVATTDKATMGYYVAKWLSKPYSLQEEIEGMSGVMVADAIFFDRVEHAPYWYMLSRMTMVVEVKYVLQPGFKMNDISPENQLPWTCSRMETTRQKAKRVSILDHKEIMEKAEKRGWLVYDNDNAEESNEDKSESEVESNSNDE